MTTEFTTAYRDAEALYQEIDMQITTARSMQFTVAANLIRLVEFIQHHGLSDAEITIATVDGRGEMRLQVHDRPAAGKLGIENPTFDERGFATVPLDGIEVVVCNEELYTAWRERLERERKSEAVA